jgi:hypothetical protein
MTDASIAALEATIAAIPARDEPFENFVHQGALRQLQARRAWLAEVRAALPDARLTAAFEPPRRQ